MTPIERRLAKLEQAALPSRLKTVRRLAEPLDGATDDEREKYAGELAQAKAECDFVIILTALKPLRPIKEGQCVYVGDETTAQIQMAAHLPSKRGNDCLLTDVVQDAAKTGNVLRPAMQPTD